MVSHHAETGNFVPLDIGLPEPRFSSWRWWIVAIRWETADETSARANLFIDLEEAVPSVVQVTAMKATISLNGPLSFRVMSQDDIHSYLPCDFRGEKINRDFYQIRSSTYLDEYREINVFELEVRHFVLLGGSEFLEFLADDCTTLAVNDIQVSIWK